MRATAAVLLVACIASVAREALAARLSPDQVPELLRRAKRVAPARLQPSGNRGDGPVDFKDADDVGVRAHWALLCAGSAGWGNYRHQADVLHAYHVLHAGGLHPDHMVVMVADDLAHAPENPFPGRIFNRPGGPDVYGGVPIDYRGEDVTSATFLAVLEGAARKVEGVGSGRVVASDAVDRVFVFYSDHGAAGVVGMPSGPFLYADELAGAVARKRAAGGYKELVMYIEACESGSMFEGLLGADQGVYVTTAANALESSWATYCPTFAGGAHPMMTTCLGDLYSVAWMEDAEGCDLTAQSLLAQYRLVRARTSNNFTYITGSHVMQYGDLAIDHELAGDWEGMWHNASATPSLAARASAALAALARGDLRAAVAHAAAGKRVGGGSCLGGDERASVTAAANGAAGAGAAHHMEQRDADLAPLHSALVAAATPADRSAAHARLQSALRARRSVDAAARDAVASLLAHPAASPLLLQHAGWDAAAAFPTASAPALALLSMPAGAAYVGAWAPHLLVPSPALVTALVGPLPGAAAGAPLVREWGCLRAMVRQWEEACGPLGQYGMRHTRLMANLCNAGVAPAQLGAALAHHVCPLGPINDGARV